MSDSANFEQCPALYSDEWTVSPGESVAIRCSGVGAATLSLVRLCGLIGDHVPTGFVEQVCVAGTPVSLAVRDVPKGSFAYTARGPRASIGSAWRWSMLVRPTLTDRGQIMQWGESGPVLWLESGSLHVQHGDARASVPIDNGAWSAVTLTFATNDGLRLTVVPVGVDAWYRRGADVACRGTSTDVDGPLTLARGFSGKLEAPELQFDGTLAAAWDFARDIRTQSVPGSGPQSAPLTLVNAPRRGVTSSAWNGECHDWTARPDHFGAIHFHDDDLSDCHWPVTAHLTIPTGTASGIYAARLESDGGVAYAPLFVRPTSPARLAFVASTFSYLAYTNSVWASPSGEAAALRHPRDAALARRFGLSMYCRHRDGSGIGLVSTRRPVLHATPGFFGEAIGGQVALNDDLRITHWLDSVGEPYDVVTDHDLHQRGAEALDGYAVVITGAHPEYHSTESLTALTEFTAGGGRLMYMGGNGFYWRVTLLPDAPHVMELRRAEGGVRIWAEPEGEYHHQSDGALGGLWRRIGRAPNLLVGVGFSAQGSETETRPYVRTAAATDSRVAFIFDGVTDELIGATDSPCAAAGYEMDRADVQLGTPRHALVVARSLPFGPSTAPVNEERLTHELVDAHDPIRADMTFFEGPNGGAVFSASSLLFAASLGETDGAGRVALNVLRRFLENEPFVIPSMPGAD